MFLWPAKFFSKNKPITDLKFPDRIQGGKHDEAPTDRNSHLFDPQWGPLDLAPVNLTELVPKVQPLYGNRNLID